MSSVRGSSGHVDGGVHRESRRAWRWQADDQRGRAAAVSFVGLLTASITVASRTAHCVRFRMT